TDASALEAMPDPEDAVIERTASVRYAGQAHHLDIPLDPNPDADAVSRFLARFETEYETLFGKGAGFREAGFEILSVRSVASRHTEVGGGRGSGGDPFVQTGTRGVIFDYPHAPDETAVYSCRWPAGGQQLAGPALINLPGCVLVVPPGGSATTDDAGNIHVKVGTK
ncbi:MAG: hypothetical protein Q4G46_15425, partial [Propionibacteriaceae bacterium]|nr:hypothetical protein [Propionibacteriaceae bacterium]